MAVAVAAEMDITGKYELTHSENFEEYMKAVGVGMVMRKLAAHSKPVTKIEKTGPDSFLITTTTTFKTIELAFRLGENFKEKTADGRVCQATVTMEGPRQNKMKHEQVFTDGKTLVIWREFTPNEMRMILEAPGVICTRVYSKILV